MKPNRPDARKAVGGFLHSAELAGPKTTFCVDTERVGIGRATVIAY